MNAKKVKIENLEIGKKYLINAYIKDMHPELDRPRFKLINLKFEFIYKKDDLYYFVDEKNIPCVFSKNDLVGQIEKYSDPFKNTIEGYVGYIETRDSSISNTNHLDEDHILTKLFRKLNGFCIYECKKDIPSAFAIKKFRITVEEIEETENE